MKSQEEHTKKSQREEEGWDVGENSQNKNRALFSFKIEYFEDQEVVLKMKIGVWNSVKI